MSGNRPRIVLVGPPGAGKSTVGRRLSAALGTAYHDLDDHIVEAAGLPVPVIFATHGEAHFRRLETELLARALGGGGANVVGGANHGDGGGANVDDANHGDCGDANLGDGGDANHGDGGDGAPQFGGVLALGGGTPVQLLNQRALAAYAAAGGIVAFLDVSVDAAVARLGEHNTDRPLLAGDTRAKFTALLAARRDIYEAVSTVIVDTSGRNATDITEELLTHIAKEDADDRSQ